MFWTKGKLAVLFLTMGLTCAVVGVSLGLGNGDSPGDARAPGGAAQARDDKPAGKQNEQPPAAKLQDPPPADAGGSQDPLEAPLPPGAIARLGTRHFRTGNESARSFRAEVIARRQEAHHQQRDRLPLRSSGTPPQVVTNRGSGGVFVWDADTGKLILHVPNAQFWPGNSVEISHDGKRLFTLEITESPKVADVVLKVYELATGKLLKTIEENEPIASFAVSGDDRTLALEFVRTEELGGSYPFGYLHHSRLELRDLATDRVLHKFGEERSPGWHSWLLFAQDGKSLFAIDAFCLNAMATTYSVFNPGGTAQSTVRRFDLTTARLKSKMTIDGLAYDENLVWDGKSLIAAGSKIWDVDKERLHWASKGDLGEIFGFMPDGRTVLAGPAKGQRFGGPYQFLKLVQWDLESDREIRRFPDPDSRRFVIARDGKSAYGGLASAAPYGVYHWDTATGKEIVHGEQGWEPVLQACALFTGPEARRHVGQAVVAHLGPCHRQAAA